VQEIIEYTADDEVAVCNLASIALPTFANTEGRPYDFQKLYEVSRWSVGLVGAFNV
jgi:ribonucleoside-diphosphate reductase subunit M1